MFTIDETAPVVVRLSTTIDAPLLPGASFTWKTHGLDITSTVRELTPGARIVWGGPANGIEGIHAWTFEQADGQVTVHTEESWSGAPVEAAVTELGQALHNSLTAWLAALKSRAEQTS